MRDLQKRASKGEIYADRKGEVYDLQIAVGKALQKGGEVFHIFENNSGDNLVICYVPLTDAKKVETGMEVQIYPSTVNKQEYGHMIAKVEYINPYVATAAEMKRHFGSGSSRCGICWSRTCSNRCYRDSCILMHERQIFSRMQ